MSGRVAACGAKCIVTGATHNLLNCTTGTLAGICKQPEALCNVTVTLGASQARPLLCFVLEILL